MALTLGARGRMLEFDYEVSPTESYATQLVALSEEAVENAGGGVWLEEVGDRRQEFEGRSCSLLASAMR